MTARFYAASRWSSQLHWPLGPAAAQSNAATKLEGVINDYTDVASASGPWHITGDWSASSSRATAERWTSSPAWQWVRSTSGGSSRAPTSRCMTVRSRPSPTAIASGEAAITSNGALAGFTGSQVDIELTGNTALPFSNVKITFGGAGAIGHFGDLPLDGVVTVRQ